MEFPIAQLNLFNLTQDNTYTRVQKYWHDTILYARVEDIPKGLAFFQEWLEFHPEFRQTNPTRVQELERYFIEAAWVGLIVMSDERIIELLHKNLGVLFAIQSRYGIPITDINLAEDILTEKLRVRLLSIANFTPRNAYKKRLYEALITNEEVLTTAPFYLNIKNIKPTIKQWFSDYIEFKGPGPFLLSQQQEFFLRNENYQRLNAEERAKLKLIFTVYERLHNSSRTEEGMEETYDYADENGNSGIIRYGEIIPDNLNVYKEYQNIMKNFKDLLTESDIVLHDKPVESDQLSSRPPVDQIEVKTATKPIKSSTTTFGPDHFTDQDAAEIATHAEAAKALSNSNVKNYTQQIAQLKQTLGITFKRPEQDKQFGDVVESALRGLRDIRELHGYLEQLGLTILQISQVVAEVKKTLPVSKKGPVLAGATPTPTFDTVKKTIVAKTSVVKQEPIDVVGDVSTTRNVSTNTQPMVRPMLPRLRRPRRFKKPIIDDVKLQQSMIMSPIDELKAMDVVEFRRLAPNPAIAAMKLKNKIDLLAEESIEKQTEGIQAFKLSALNAQYLEIGNQSITTNQPVADIITQRQTQSNSGLSLAEFNAIADLNKQLRF